MNSEKKKASGSLEINTINFVLFLFFFPHIGHDGFLLTISDDEIYVHPKEIYCGTKESNDRYFTISTFP